MHFSYNEHAIFISLMKIHKDRRIYSSRVYYVIRPPVYFFNHFPNTIYIPHYLVQYNYTHIALVDY